MSRSHFIGALLTTAFALGGLAWLAQGQPAQSDSHTAGAVASTNWALFMLLGHCDTMNGPVISAAKKALSTGNVNLVLIWVQPKDEAEINRAFQEALEVRKLNAKAKALADRNFFETLVRIHRAGEGASYSGLKSAGTPLEPAVAAADKALETGTVEPLVKSLTKEVEAGIRKHFKEAMEAKRYRPNDVKAGRKFVDAYVEYVHFAEGIGAAAASSVHGHFPEHKEGR